MTGMLSYVILSFIVMLRHFSCICAYHRALCPELPWTAWWMVVFFEKCKLDCFRCWKWWCFAEDLHVRTVKLTFSYYFLSHLIPTLCHRVTYWIIMAEVFEKCKLDYFRCWKWWCFAEDPHVQTVKLTFSYYFLFHLIPTLCHRVTYCIILWHILQRIFLLA